MRLMEFSPATGSRLVDSGLHVVVTGGGGWLGQATLEMLHSSFGTYAATRVHVFGSRRRSITLRSDTELEIAPLSDLPRSTIGPHVVVHYAFGTRELASQLSATDYIARNNEITETVASHVRRARPEGVVVVSSGAVYLGDDLASNPYGVLKARDEERFIGLAKQLRSGSAAPRIVVPRLFNLSGPFINKHDHYVLASIIRDVAGGGPIRLHASHPVVRSYVHVRDLVELTFSMMLGDGPLPDAAFDTAGEREIEVGELAELVASVMGATGMPIHRPPVDVSRPDRYVGDPTVIRSLARSHGVEMQDLTRQIQDTARFMAS
jgi:UDP-glucuronate decarboxylase